VIYLVRHAEAHDADRDELRELTDRGKRVAERLGQFLRQARIVDAEVIWHSTLVRARQTAALMGREMGISILKEIKGLAPNDSPAAFARKLTAVRSDIVIVGHNPHLTALGTLLVKGEGANLPAVEFPKCAALALNNVGSGEPGEWCVAWHLSPAMLDA
jgi:phosphohistidine phosphatase